MSKKYYIYHIKGVKIGVSTQPEVRAQRQGYSNFEILEKYNDIYKVSEREIELQKEYGYPIDKILYWKTYQQKEKYRTLESCIKGGKTQGLVQGKKNVESGHMAKIRNLPQTKEAQKLVGKVQGKKNVESGQILNLSAARKRAVLQFDKDNNFIKEWESAKDAANILNLHGPNIAKVCKGKYKTTGGFIFKYKN